MRKRVGAGYVAAAVLPVVAVAIIATHIAGPHSRWIGLAVYGLGWVAMILAIRNHPRAAGVVREGQGAAKALLKAYWRLILSGAALLGTGAALFVLIPTDRVEFVGDDPAVIRREVTTDFQTATRAIRGMESLLDAHIGLFADTASVTDPAKRAELIGVWASFADYAMQLEELVERHQYFYQINPLEHADLNGLSFLTGYASLVTELEQTARVVDTVHGNREIETTLDEGREALGIPSRMLHHLQEHLSRPDTLLRLHAGRAHLEVVVRAGALPTPEQKQTIARTKRGYDELAARTQRPDLAIDNPLDALERTAYVAWYPVQRGISRAMANIRFTGRDNFVSKKDLDEARSKLEPGDILLERRNWYLTNVGLPGFWPHAALYTGTLAEIDAYFRNDARGATGGMVPSAFVAERFAKLAEAFSEPEDGHDRRIIEAMGQGVVLTSLEHSGHADYLAVLRPKLTKEAKLAALVRAFGYFGKPYDFDFDFITDDKIVCSELVYKAYRSPDAAAGLDFELTPAAGRRVLSPNDIVKKFGTEGDDAELSFVLFYDGSEKDQKAVHRKADALRESWKRPKWDHMQR